MWCRTKQLIHRWMFALALLATLAACTPSNQQTPTLTLPVKVKTPTPTPIPPTVTITSTSSRTPTPTPETCRSVPGGIVKGIIETKQLPKPMSYFVYIPPCYIERPNQRYPVLYLLHGQTYAEDQWIRLGVPTTLDKLITTGVVAPFLIVFPYDYSYLQPTQYHFEDVFMQELLPEIDSTYRTLPNPAQRSIGGLSRGAAWALHLGINHPDVFGAIGAHSPVMFYTDGIRLPITLQNLPVGMAPRLFLDIGDNDRELQHNLEFKKFLDEHDIPHEWHVSPGFHDEKYWSTHVETYLRWYASGWVK